MVAITTFISAISLALLANAAPSVEIVEKRQGNAAIDFTLYSPDNTHSNQCFGNIPNGEIHLRTPSLNKNGTSACYTINFSTLEIWNQHGLDCHGRFQYHNLSHSNFISMKSWRLANATIKSTSSTTQLVHTETLAASLPTMSASTPPRELEQSFRSSLGKFNAILNKSTPRTENL
jgi:hypothetical protein